MPAITSPLIALRLSGRLMVIQNACPRFSRMTELSVMVYPLVCFLRWKHSRDWPPTASAFSGRSVRLPDPDLVVVERGAADRRHRLGAGEHVDASAADMLAILMDRFRDQHAAPHAIEILRDQRGLASGVTERHGIAVGNAEGGGIERMDHHRRLALASPGRRRLVEGGIEERARRAGREPERMGL